MKYNKWTDEQIDFVLKLRADGLTWNRISRALENTYGIKRTGANINNKINHTMKKEENKMKIPENYEPATKKQCRYYAQLKSDDNTTKKELNLTTELLYGNSLKGQLSKSFLQKSIAEIIIVNKKKAGLGRGNHGKQRNRWTTEEDIIIFQSMYDCEVEKGKKKDACKKLGTKFNGRTVRSIEQRWSNLKKGGQTSKYVAFKRQKLEDILLNKSVIKPKVEKLSEKIEVFVEKTKEPILKEVLETISERKHERSRKAWKSDEEFELLCNFYELSIDEARNQFGRSYASLAHRLEMIVDSEQPEHIALLKEAAKVISKRKKEEAKNANMSRWKRRSIARKAKKAAKLEKKLNKLRGV
mgnify:CR=1 FL=1|tara:strand:- start:515 stop:1582 length:1068 start_codon:yes stop_codon:yes gene_type:complete